MARTKYDYPKYGYIRTENGFIIDEEAAKIIRIIFDMRLNGNLHVQIAEYLNSHSIPTTANYLHYKNRNKSKKWACCDITDILYDARYCGEDIYPAIIPSELFYKIANLSYTNLPFGYTYDEKRQVIIDPSADATIQKIFELALNGFTIPRILMFLEDNNLCSQYSNKWNFVKISSLLNNIFYIGSTDKQPYHEEMISKETFYCIQENLLKAVLPPYGYKRNPVFPYNIITDETLTAPAVRKIFTLYNNNNLNTTEIAKILTEQSIITPVEYKNQKSYNTSSTKAWSGSSVNRIIQKENMYLYGKYDLYNESIPPLI